MAEKLEVRVLGMATGGVDPNCLTEGQIGRIIKWGDPFTHYTGKHLFRVYENFVLLESPNTTWRQLSGEGIRVEILPRGTKVELTIL